MSISPFFLVGFGAAVLAVVVSGAAIVTTQALERPALGSRFFVAAMVLVAVALVALGTGGVLLYLNFR